MKGNRGIAQVLVVVAIAVAGILIAVPAYKAVKSFAGLFSGDSKAKTQVTQLVDVQAQETAAQKTKDQAAADAAANAAKVQAAKDARLDQAHQYVVGTGIALGKETSPSINVQVATLLNSDADKAMDPLDQAKIDQMVQLVNQLTAKDAQDVAAGNAQLAAMSTQLATERQTETTLRAQQVALNNQVAADQVTVNTLQTKVSSDGQALAKWASDNQSLLARIGNLTKWLIILGAVILLVHWLLPLIGTAFPAFAPVAKFASALIAVPLHYLHVKEQALLAKAKADVESVLATTKTQLASEVAAHAATTATLVAVATAPATPAPVVTTPPIVTPSTPTTTT